MSRVTFEDYDASRHRNPMYYVDLDAHEIHSRAPTIVTAKVCIVDVCGFTFTFHSLIQLRQCLDYYSQLHHPSSRLPVYSGAYGGDHEETQRWFERLPQFLLEKPKREKVVAALTKAIAEYSKLPDVIQ